MRCQCSRLENHKYSVECLVTILKERPDIYKTIFTEKSFMDEYTEKTKKWLDKRFKMCNKEGVYFAHQPIYGFGKGNYEPYLIPRYVSNLSDYESNFLI